MPWGPAKLARFADTPRAPVLARLGLAHKAPGRWLHGDSHGLIIGEIDSEPVRDLLRTPRCCPPPVSSPSVTATGPAHLGSWHQLAIWAGDLTTQTILHILTKFVVGGQLGELRAAGTPLCVPLRCRCPINHTTTTSCGVAAQLPRNRRRATTKATTDLPHPHTLRTEDSDLFPFGKRQIMADEVSQGVAGSRVYPVFPGQSGFGMSPGFMGFHTCSLSCRVGGIPLVTPVGLGIWSWWGSTTWSW